MSSSHLSNADFFGKLTDLFNTRQNKDHGSIYLTQKRLTYQEGTTSPVGKPAVDDFSDLNLAEPLPVIVRATDGNGKRGKSAKTKLSTVVKPEEMEAFFTKYAEVCKTGMSSLKKRDRRGRKAKKRKGGATGAAGEKA